jgi:hypothetical protein
VPIFSQEEHAHAWAELKSAGVRSRYGVDPRDAVALLRYVMMAVKFALIVRPDFTELRLAALMYDIWRHGDQAAADDTRPLWAENDPHATCTEQHDPEQCPRRAMVLEVREAVALVGAAVPRIACEQHGAQHDCTNDAPALPASWDTPTDEQLEVLVAGLKALP